MKILVVENLPAEEQPWWLSHVHELPVGVTLDIWRVHESGQRLWAIVKQLVGLARRTAGYDVVITMQDSRATFFLAFLNRFRFRKRHLHVVHEFITREPSGSLYSWLKYRFLRFALSSVSGIHCSARSEHAYYRTLLRLPHTRFRYIPLSTNPKFLHWPSREAEALIVSAGRTGRDYATLLSASAGLPVRVVIVATPRNLSGLPVPANVDVRYDIPQEALADLLAASRFVVIPLQNRKISVGQSVILLAMALGKAVITSRLAAVADYVKHDETGMLVPPEDPVALRRAMDQLLSDAPLARELGEAARKRVAARFVPEVTLRCAYASVRSLLPADLRSGR